MVLVWIFALIYFVAIIVMGAVASRWVHSGKDFMIAGRDVSWPLQGFGMTSILIAGTGAATIGALGYTGGYVAHWWITGWIIAAVLGAFTIARFARRTGGVTMIEWIDAVFGPQVRLLAGVALALGLLFSPLANILGGGLIVSGLTGVSPDITIFVLGIATISYIVIAGLWAAVFTNILQYALFTLAFIGAVLLVIVQGGGFGVLDTLPASYFNPLPHGPVAAIDWTAGSAFGLFFLMFALAFGGVYWHRAASSRSPNDATKAWLFGALLTLPFAIVMPLAGMYLRATGVQLEDPQQAFGVFISGLSPILGALLLTGILAATMSTAEAGVMAGTSILFRDVIQRATRQTYSYSASIRWVRVMTLLYGLVAITGAIVFNRAVPGVGALVGLAFLSAFCASILPSILTSMFARNFCYKEAALLSILAGIVYTVYSLVSGTYLTYHPMLISFILATVVFAVVTGIVRSTGPWWDSSQERSAQSEQVEPVSSR